VAARCLSAFSFGHRAAPTRKAGEIVNSADDTALLSAEETSKRLGVSAEWVYLAARQRRIESVKIGSRLLFRPEAVEDYIYAHTREPVGA
jgi:excisionase family DNA binding protein